MSGRFLKKVACEASEASDQFFYYFQAVSMFLVIRRAGWAHPNSKSDTMFRTCFIEGLRHSGDSKDLKIEIELGFIFSNLDLNAFPGLVFQVDSAIRKEFHAYSL